MKKMILLLLISCSMAGAGFAQYYEASYECEFSAAINSEGKPVLSGEGLPVKTTFVYAVKADAHYLHVKGWLREGNEDYSGGPVSIRAQASQTEVIIDLDKLVAFLPDEEAYQLIDLYNLVPGCEKAGADSVRHVSRQEAAVTVTLAKELPWYVSPGLLLRSMQRCTGIRKVETKYYSIVLTGTPKQTNGKLDYSKQFSAFDKNQSYERYRFFE